MFRMKPADQGLTSGDPEVLGRYLWLYLHEELVFRYGAHEVPFKRVQLVELL